MTKETPSAELDKRFSSPDATAVPWQEAEKQLEKAEVYWLSTIRPEGRPHVTTLMAVWLDGALYFSTGENERKAKNLSQNKQVVVTTGCNTLTEGLDIVVEGDAVRTTNQEQLERLAKLWTTRWDGRWQYVVRDGCFFHHDEHEISPNAVLVFSVTPTKILAFAKGNPFSHTRHQF